jgi:citrate synthase
MVKTFNHGIFEDKAFTDNMINELSKIAEKNNVINPEFYKRYDVKRGLRNENGTGVLVGLTRIGNVHGYTVKDGERLPDEGKLTYRGIDLETMVEGFQSENRFGYEETCYLLLFGELPNKSCLGEVWRSFRKL